MIFVPAVQPLAATSPLAWCFAFVDGQLLLPEADDAALQPQPLQGFESLAVARHYLGRLDGIDCWALHLERGAGRLARAPRCARRCCSFPPR